MVMEGVVAAYLLLKNGNTLNTDYLGPGSVIGQYSFIEEEISTFGFKSASQNGALVLSFKLSDFDKLAKFNPELRDKRWELLEQKHSNNHHTVDFVRINPNSELE